METVKIEGDNNIANTGVIQDDCIENSTIINLNLIDLYKGMAENEKEKSLEKLAEAIETIAKTEQLRAEEGIIKAKADENNSLANLNYSKIMLEDQELIKSMFEKLK